MSSSQELGYWSGKTGQEGGTAVTYRGWYSCCNILISDVDAECDLSRVLKEGGIQQLLRGKLIIARWPNVIMVNWS